MWFPSCYVLIETDDRIRGAVAWDTGIDEMDAFQWKPSIKECS
jgi:hypothetical protein